MKRKIYTFKSKKIMIGKMNYKMKYKMRIILY